MAIECKINNSHYKNSRFSTKKEQDLNQFKKDNITHDLEEIKSIALNNISFYHQIVKINDKIKIPPKNAILAIRTQSQINAFSLFIQFIESYGKVDFLQIQTYTIGEETIFTLLELLNSGKIKQLQIIMTETAIFRLPKIYKLLKELFSNHERCNLCFYWVHSKVHLIKAGNDKFVIDGSGNFSMNAQVEQYNIFHSDEMFDFDYNLSETFYFGQKLRKKHEIYKNF